MLRFFVHKKITYTPFFFNIYYIYVLLNWSKQVDIRLTRSHSTLLHPLVDMNNFLISLLLLNIHLFICFSVCLGSAPSKMYKRATPKWVTKSCDNRYDEVCGWNSIKDVTSCLVFNPFWEKIDLDLWPRPKVKVIDTWVIECALLGCTLVPGMKSVGDIASAIWPVLWFLTHFWEKLTFGQGHRH